MNVKELLLVIEMEQAIIFAVLSVAGLVLSLAVALVVVWGVWAVRTFLQSKNDKKLHKVNSARKDDHGALGWDMAPREMEELETPGDTFQV